MNTRAPLRPLRVWIPSLCSASCALAMRGASLLPPEGLPWAGSVSSPPCRALGVQQQVLPCLQGLGGETDTFDGQK